MGNAIPRLDAARIDALSKEWSDGGLWDDIALLVELFLRSDGADRALRWHHLVLAIGNFKRQPGRRLRPLDLVDLLPKSAPSPRSAEVTIPGTAELPLACDGAATWKSLQHQLRGAGVATATTVLAALWPASHFVFDWRVFAAANGLRVAGGLEPSDGIDIASSSVPDMTLDQYAQVRSWLLAASDETQCPLLRVERSLYCLSQRMQSKTGRTWAEYSRDLVAELDRVAT